MFLSIVMNEFSGINESFLKENFLLSLILSLIYFSNINEQNIPINVI